MADSVMPGSLVVPVTDLRQVVLSGPGVEVDAVLGTSALWAVARAGTVDAVLAQVDAVGGRRRSLTPSVVTVLILGLCLFSGEGYSGVLRRLWPLLGTFNPGFAAGTAGECGGVVGGAGPVTGGGDAVLVRVRSDPTEL